ncbi:hypothetical protein FUAX_55810 (plasmid) [Fulvitalea axinellae]|uniref:Uncharacterized protein n=1 Tax=Fulvitalea axinellae TaxID=1182444 RepID=A0AAU9D3J6_9BACT|nr:hypothetical protein FUAX_55810 [Fulvitalea axinellae]
MFSHSDYISLFEGIAEKHVDIRHKDGGEAFAVIQIEPNSLFDSIDLSDYKNAKKRIKAPFMILQAEDSEYDKKFDQKRSYVNGAFIIADKVNDRSDKTEIRERTKRIGEEIIGYLGEKINHGRLYGADVRFLEPKAKSEFVGPFDGFLGARFLVTFELLANRNLEYKPERFGE